MIKNTIVSKTVLALATMAFFATPAAAQDVPVPQAVKEAVSPMPEIMSVVVSHAEALKLTPKQVAKLRIWRDDNQPKFAALAWKVRFGEKAVNHAVLKGADADVVAKKADKVSADRKSIVALKTKCRDAVRSVLDATQWSKAMTLVRASQVTKVTAMN